MDIKLYGPCNRITASIKDDKRISIKIGKAGPVVYLESSEEEKKKELEKLDKAKESSILDDESAKLDEDSVKLDEDSGVPSKTKSLESTDQTKGSRKLDRVKGFGKSDEGKDLGNLAQDEDLRKSDQGKDEGKFDGSKSSRLAFKSKTLQPEQMKLKSKESLGIKSKKKPGGGPTKVSSGPSKVGGGPTKVGGGPTKVGGDPTKFGGGPTKVVRTTDSFLKLSPKERSRISESKFSKDKSNEYLQTTPGPGSKIRSNVQSSKASMDNMDDITAMEYDMKEGMGIPSEYQGQVMMAMDSTQDGFKREGIPGAIYPDVRKPRPISRKVAVDHHKNCFPPLTFPKKQPRKSPFMFSSQTTFMDRHKNCFPDHLFYKTYLSSKSKTRVKTYTDYHKNCIPKYPDETSGRKRKMSVSEEVLSPATVKKTLLERHKNCIPNMVFKDTYLRREEHKRKLSTSAASVISLGKASIDRFISKFDESIKSIPSPKLPKGDQNIDVLPKIEDISTATPKSPVPIEKPEEPKKTTNGELDTIIAEKEEEIPILSPDLPAGDENENTLQETSENVEQPLLT